MAESAGLTYLASRQTNFWRIILDYVAANKVQQDGTPMLANNISNFNARRLLGS